VSRKFIYSATEHVEMLQGYLITVLTHRL